MLEVIKVRREQELAVTSDNPSTCSSAVGGALFSLGGALGVVFGVSARRCLCFWVWEWGGSMEALRLQKRGA